MIGARLLFSRIAARFPWCASQLSSNVAGKKNKQYIKPTAPTYITPRLMINVPKLSLAGSGQDIHCTCTFSTSPPESCELVEKTGRLMEKTCALWESLRMGMYWMDPKQSMPHWIPLARFKRQAKCAGYRHPRPMFPQLMTH